MIIAKNYKVLAQSPYPDELWTASPSLAKLPHGRLVASYEWFTRASQHKKEGFNHTEIQVSDDNGTTWRQVATVDIMWGTIFTVEENLYILGVRRADKNIAIVHSPNGGESWSETIALFNGHFHSAPTSVLIRGNLVYRAFETGTGSRSEWKSFVVVGDISHGLLEPVTWRVSNKLAFPGVPDALTQHRYTPGHAEQVGADSWLEGNVIDVRGEMRVMLRTMIDGHSTAGLAAVCRLQDNGSTLDYRFLQFYPMPGAQCKFHIVYDSPSDLFWTAVTIPTNTWQDRTPYRAVGFRGPPGNERRILILMYSIDALNWFQAGCVAMDRHVCNSYSYTSQLITGDDLLVLARTSQGGKNQHDTNMITLHRVREFRSLAMHLVPRLDDRH